MFKKLMKLMKLVFKMLLYLILGSVVVFVLTRAVTGLVAWNKTYSETGVPARRVAIVFGAGLWRDGSPTPILQDRVETGAKLYFAGKVEKLLMSGDNSQAEYNEPEAMRQYALSLGVPDAAIVLDYAGRRTYDSCFRAKEIFRTYDSCFRAKEIFRVEQAILVTQKFHLARALFLCNALGLDGVGVEANNRSYLKRSLVFWNLRELPATLTAFADILTRPQPVLGDPEPIFPEKFQ